MAQVTACTGSTPQQQGVCAAYLVVRDPRAPRQQGPLTASQQPYDAIHSSPGRHHTTTGVMGEPHPGHGHTTRADLCGRLGMTGTHGVKLYL